MLAEGKVKVVTTFYPVYEFTKGVIGNDGDVSLLMKAGTEPHDFEPSTKDIKNSRCRCVRLYGRQHGNMDF